MKKNLSLFIAFCLCLGILAGCKSPDAAESSGVPSASAGESNLPSNSGTDSSTAGSGTPDASGTPTGSGVNSNASNSGTTSKGGGSSESTKKTNAPAGEKELINNTYTTGFPIVKDKITLKVMAYKYANQPDYATMESVEYLEKNTGIHLEWSYCNWGEDARSKQILAFKSGNMPDIFVPPSTTFSDADIATYAKDKKLVNISAMLDKWAPTIREWLEKYPSAAAVETTSDGNMYSLPKIEVNDRHMMWNQKLYIRKDWLTALGLSMPKTMDEFYTILTAFKTLDPNGNGKADEIPFLYQGLYPGFFANYGLVFERDFTNGYCLDQQTGQLVYAYTTEAYKKGITYLNKLYKEELISKEFAAGGNQEPAIKAGVVGCFYSYADFLEADGDLLESYEMMEPMSEDGNNRISYYCEYLNYTKHAYLITSACKYPEAALRLADYFYSFDGTNLARIGVPGEDFVNVDGGKIEVKTNLPYEQQIQRVIGDTFALANDNSYGDRQIQISENKEEAELLRECMAKLKPYNPKLSFVPPFMSTATAEKYNAINFYKSINEYSQGTAFEFMTGARSLNEWNQFKSELDKRGLAEFTKLYQQDYARSKK